MIKTLTKQEVNLYIINLLIKTQKTMNPEMQKVQSLQINFVGYDKESETLLVTFKTGTTYSYDKVPEKVYNELLAAKSVSKYFNANVKFSYKYQKQ